MSQVSRRGVLSMIGGLGAAGLAGCGPQRPLKPASVTTAVSSAPAAPVSLAPADWGRLATSLHGKLLRPDGSGYTDAARLYNPRFDGLAPPAAIARCADAADVQSCVRFAADTRTPFAVRAGGHSYGAWSTSTGLVVDLSPVKAVTVDTAAGTARIGAGARLIDVYAALAAKNVALAAGSCPSVGFSGLTLGGGVGVLTRAWGLTCDAVRGFDIVTADGRLRQVDERHDPDLFWAVRGGGAGFGAVTAWTVAVRPAPTVNTFFFAWDISQAADVLDAWQRWGPGTDPRLWSTCKLLADPAKDRVRATVSGTWIGAASALDAQLQPLLSALGQPASRQVKAYSYLDAMLLEAGCSGRTTSQCGTDAYTPAKREAFAGTSSVMTAALPAAAVEAAVEHTRAAMRVPSLVQGGVSFDLLGGAVAKVPKDGTAFAHRAAVALVQYTATWKDGAAPAGPFDTYVRDFRAGMRTWLGDAAYVNYADPSIERYGDAYWGANLPRLQQINRAVDPHGLFASAQTVKS